MTRKHYEAIAAAIRAARPKEGEWNDTDAARHTWERTVTSVANALQQDNPKFDYWRFRAACYA